MSDNDIVVAEFRELQTVDPSVIELNRSISTGGIIPSPDREVKENWLTDSIPDMKKRWREDGGFLYVDIEYVEERLNNAYGAGRWTFVPTMVRTFDGKTKDGEPKTEIFVEGRLYAVGAIDLGIVGVGTGNYFPNNPRATYSNAYATAISEATKNAARKLGIGLDLKDRDGQKLEQLQTSLAQVVEAVYAVNPTEVVDILNQSVPLAVQIDDDGKFVFNAGMVDETQVEKVTKAVMKAAQKK